ncbi:Flp family type IVb pilin [Vibrio europaeus]|uniref:Flp family type IVb pilin n=1 Tax=Vibrio europaeus TaxID=300876 RepID=A0AAE7DZ97_9VIBR|nr:Flp family type IVb pilin [Vibrio europaeus]MDC5811945.1 Flp family type IVb pilin [Vibrio europaeus]QJY38380.1 Flp family type IVb pilin [Vibrio europaeus]QPG33396.1 Flp family type IVb pilin [Vibrio europaeus]
MKKLLNDFIKNEDGVTAIEYAVMGVALAGSLALIMGSGTATGGGTGFLGELSKAFNSIAKNMGQGS